MTERPGGVDSAISLLVNDCVVVRALGDIDIANAAEFEETIRLAGGADAPVLVIDLSEVSFIDSSGLGVLVTHQYARRDDDAKVFRVVASSAHLLKIFEVTGLDQVISIFPDLASATKA